MANTMQFIGLTRQVSFQSDDESVENMIVKIPRHLIIS